MTYDEATSAALDLLNRAEEDRRAEFEQGLKEQADVERAMDFAAAWREVFVAADADPYEASRHEGAIAEVGDLFEEIGPTYRTKIRAGRLSGTGRFRLEIDTVRAGAVSEVYRVIMLPTPVGGAKWEVCVWEVLLQAARGNQGEAPRVGVCRQCEDLFMRGRADQVYCSGACRQAAYEERQRNF